MTSKKEPKLIFKQQQSHVDSSEVSRRGNQVALGTQLLVTLEMKESKKNNN